jgi:zinc transporter
MHNAPDSTVLDRCAGLVFGFHIHAGHAHPVGDETLGQACAAPHDWLWLHLALSDHRARRFIEALEAAPEAARALLLSGEDRVQLHLTATGAWGVLPDIERDFADHSLGSGRFAFWLDATHLVTARRHPLRASEHLREEVEQGRVPASPAEALARLPEHFAALVEARMVALAAELGRIEDEVLADRFTDNRTLGALRRELSRYAREFSGLKSAIHRAMSARHGGMTNSPLLEHLPPLMQDVEDFDRDAAGLTDRARLIYEEIDARIAATTNRSLSALTVLSTLMLPPTLIAGLFGMNVPGLPWATDKQGFWIVILFCTGLGVAMYALLRRFRILP